MGRGKYGAVIDKLPRVLGEEPDYQQKIDAVKDAILKETPQQGFALAARFAQARANVDAIKAVLSEHQLEVTALEQLIVDQYEAEGEASITLEDGASVSVQWEPAAKVLDKDLFRRWCLDNGLARSLVLPPASTTALIKEYLLKGLKEPAGTQATARAKVVFRK